MAMKTTRCRKCRVEVQLVKQERRGVIGDRNVRLSAVKQWRRSKRNPNLWSRDADSYVLVNHDDVCPEHPRRKTATVKAA